MAVMAGYKVEISKQKHCPRLDVTRFIPKIPHD
jgi:hypothetical protein